MTMPSDQIAKQIRLLRAQKVLLDADLAQLYGVATKVLVQAVKRNVERFPSDFMFQLSTEEWAVLRSQTVTSSSGHGGRRYLPLAFTEQGVAMLSSVLGSPQAIAVNIEIVRAFVRLRDVIASNKELSLRVERLESQAALTLMENDRFTHETRTQLQQIFTALRELMAQPTPPKMRPIGFVMPEEESTSRPER